jgi:hypothetical protein
MIGIGIAEEVAVVGGVVIIEEQDARHRVRVLVRHRVLRVVEQANSSKLQVDLLLLWLWLPTPIKRS